MDNEIKTILAQIMNRLDMQDDKMNKLEALLQNQSEVQYSGTNLDNCTDVAHNPSITNSQGVIDNMGYSRQRVLIGYDAQGNPQYTQISGKTQDERNDAIVRAYIEYGRINEFMPQPVPPVMPSFTPIVVEKPKTDFSSFAMNDYSFRESRWEKTTLGREKSAYKKISNYFEGRYVEDITIEDVQSWMNILSEDGLSHDTIKDRKGTLGRIFESAVEKGLIPKNPVRSKLLYIPGYDSEGTQALSMREYKRLVDLLPSINDQRNQLILGLFLFTGMRRSEVLGLRRKDIDFDNKKLHVQRAVTYPNGFPVVKCTKTKAGNRYIPIPTPLLEILLKYEHVSPDSYIVTNDNGELFETAANYMSIFNKLRKDIGLPEVDALVFRSTFATMALIAGYTPKEVQQIMGHASIEVTMNIYAKCDSENLLAQRDAIPDFFKNLQKVA